jgi:hypothetical protein
MLPSLGFPQLLAMFVVAIFVYGLLRARPR